jgi:hypothetical protein
MEPIDEDKSMTLRRSVQICILFLSAAMVLGACNFETRVSADSSSQAPVGETAKPAADSSADTAARAGQAKSTSNSPPPTRPFSGIATPVRDYPRVASSGPCAPLYRNGTHGTCIADKPCRGYGIRNDENEVLCMCYLTHGGCDAKSRCDHRAHACVADTIQKNKEE